jgi:RNA polymerase sigma-70 factor (ECF subfamily)
LGRSADDCRQLQHRAKRAVAAGPARFTATRADQQRLLGALLAAARDGDLDALGALLADDATVVSDGGGKVKAALRPIIGAAKVVRFMAGVYRNPDNLTIVATEANDHPAFLVRRAAARYLVMVHATPSEIRTIYIMANPDKLTHWSRVNGS